MVNKAKNVISKEKKNNSIAFSFEVACYNKKSQITVLFLNIRRATSVDRITKPEEYFQTLFLTDKKKSRQTKKKERPSQTKIWSRSENC